MECIDAQRIISEALDKVAVDDVSVEKAKLHCTGCAECNSFVRGIAATMRTGLPPAADDLPDRIMAAVRSEAQSLAIAEATARARASAAPARAKVDPSAADSAPDTRVVVDLHDRATRRSLASWGAAAAVVLIAAGVFANQGVRQILRPDGAALTSTRIGGAPGAESALMAPSAVAPTSTAQDTTAQSTAPVAYPGDYIVVSGFAYLRANSAPDIARDTLEVVGAANTALDSTGPIRSVEVLGGDDRSRLYVERPDGALLAFDRVTREYQGRQYALQSGSIDTFGAWPTYPAGVVKPTTIDGSGPFKELPAEATGARLFEPSAGGAGLGIAVAPGTPVTDPARGNPDWTWWTPVK